MTTIDAQLEIVPARREHVPFVAWVIMAAARSHLPRGFWDLYLDRDEASVLRYLEALATTDSEHFAHYTGFLVAEVGGTPAAAMSGYFDAERGGPLMAQGMGEADRAAGITPEQVNAGMERAGSILELGIEHEPGAWIVEWVATHPDYRRRGLVDRLMAEVLDLGRRRGASVAEIGVLTGNDPAQRAYEKAGFAVVQERTHAGFEAAYGSPGARLLRRPI